MSFEINEILNEFLGSVIIIKLRNKQTIQGNLQDFDSGMNLILTNSKDLTENKTKNLDNVIIRSDNIVAVSIRDKFNSLERKDDASI
ncbi:MAG: LSM domain-containing protein [Candidatus Nitrosomaritimum aestuariumsis]|jgi:small nuclear ribonucleoprotein (snRNP)-like protein|nr:ribonucleoprotein [Nitrosopumilaceae archaeon]